MKSKKYGAWGFAGIIVVDEKGKLINSVVFKGNEEEVARKLMLLEEGKEVEEIKQIDNREDVIWELPHGSLQHQFPNIAGKYLRRNSEKMLIKEGVVKSREEYIKRVFNISKHILKNKYKNSITDDRVVIALGSSIDTLSKAFNEVVMRVRELFSLYLPGFYESCASNEEFIEKVLKRKYEDFIKEGELKAEFKEKDLLSVIGLANTAKSIKDREIKIREYVFNRVREIMPNVCALVGEEVAYRLLEEAGSLEVLARVPSSTIQVLGAEKALFMHLRGRGKSPKHGVIFLSDFVQRASRKHRGKVARVLALKISLAAKKDYFSYDGKDDLGKKLRGEMEEFLSKLK